MHSVASTVSGSMLGGTAGSKTADLSIKPDVMIRRASQRRWMLDMMGISRLIDTGILLLYAYAGATSPLIAAGYGLSGLLIIGLFIVLSENKVNDRFKEHDFIVVQSTIGLLMALVFLYLAPEVGGLFLCSIFMIYTFASLRSNMRHVIIGWTLTTVGLILLFMFTDKPLAMPVATPLERLATMLVFVTVLGRGMAIGLFSSTLQESLYRRGLQLKEAYRRIEELAELDELTGSFNRRSIMQALDDEIGRARQGTMPCAVALIDLDHFKLINDEFGHPAGDEVLRTFAITVFANIRSIDRIGRYGGEEFLLILPETADGAAQRTLNRLREMVAALDWSAISPGLKVTISAGLTMLRPDETTDSILIRVDRLLYQAKHQGRNRVAAA